MNIHLLSHIAECVRNWGPLWAYSCFQFEGMNRELKALIMEQEICHNRYVHDHNNGHSILFGCGGDLFRC